ncbi:MAG: hypothetical protein ABH804_00445 [archaeon]
MRKKGFIQIPFGWLFAILVGAVILFIAVYGITKLISTEEETQALKTGIEIGILLNPLETSFQTAQSLSVTIPAETRIYSGCSVENIFGRQLIQISQRSLGKWTKKSESVGFSNKYIFSESPAEGKKFHLFSKPFEFPFKVADLIYLTSSSEKYCFKNAPEDIKDEISRLSQENFMVENCQGEQVNICFEDGANCDVNVKRNLGYLEKGGERMYFEVDALMYAGIFSPKEIYECQLKRLMQRTEQLAVIYDEKASFILQTAECESNLNLEDLISSARNFKDSTDISSVKIIADEIQKKNDLAGCKLW